MIRMIATDLDGTLLGAKSVLPEENVRALQRAMEAGVKVVLASGRMVEATTPIGAAIGVNAPMVLFNGAMVYDPASGEILHGSCIPRDTAVEVLREIEARGCYVQVFPGRRYFFERHTEHTVFYQNKISVVGTAVGEKLSQWLKTDVYKLLCIGTQEETDAIARELSQRFPTVSFVKSSATFLEIVAKGVDKADGLRALSALTGITPEEILAFGDEQNDLPMLEYVGKGYTMENAPEAVRRQAKLIAPANTQCGLAAIVNLYLNEGRMGG